MSQFAATRQRLFVAAVASATVLGVTGCSGLPGMSTTRTVTASANGSGSASGSAGPSQSSSTSESTPTSAREVFEKTQDRVETYSSVAFSGPMDFEGENADVSLEGTTDGKSSRADVDSVELGKFEVLKVNDSGYMKAPAAFWRKTGAGAASSLVANKWIKLSADDAAAQDLQDISVKPLVESFTSDTDSESRQLLAPDAMLSTEKLDGKDVYRIESSDHKTVVWASQDGKYDLLKFVTSEDGERTEVKVSKHNSVPTISAPQDAFDPSTLSSSDGQTT